MKNLKNINISRRLDILGLIIILLFVLILAFNFEDMIFTLLIFAALGIISLIFTFFDFRYAYPYSEVDSIYDSWNNFRIKHYRIFSYLSLIRTAVILIAFFILLNKYLT